MKSKKCLVELQGYLKEKNLGGCIIEDPIDLFYLTGLQLSAGTLIVLPKSWQLLVDGRYLEVAKPLGAILSSDEAKKKCLPKNSTILIDSTRSSYDQIARWQALVRGICTLQPTPRILKELRAIKDSKEIALMKKSALLGFAGFRHICTLLKSGVTERELALAFTLYALKHGADGASFEPIIAFGKNSALPHHHSGKTKLKKGDLVLMDLGVMLNGYASDMTRVVFYGKGNPQLLALHETVKAAQKAALALCKPGAKLKDLDLGAREVMAQEGLESYFVHSLGHGLGLEVHEYPIIRKTGSEKDVVLREGMVITIEPGLYLPGKGGSRYEDTILITKKGYQNFYPEDSK